MHCIHALVVGYVWECPISTAQYQLCSVFLIDRDVMEVAKEIVATITDPQAMVGPEVS